MAAPSKNWTNISDTQIDADSPLDEMLFAGLRDDLVHLKEWLGNSYAAAQDHDHDGVNSKPVASVGDGAISTSKIVNANVTLSKLKMALASYTISGPWTGNVYVSIGSDYAHVPKITGTNNSSPIDYSLSWVGLMPSGNYFHLSGTAIDGTVIISTQYHAN